MAIERVKRLLNQKENLHPEFKEAATALPKNLFESICAMLNRDGGDIILGADDRGQVTGISGASADAMITDLVNLSNNPTKLDPPFILFPQEHQLEGKTIIHIQVPASSQVHKTANTIYDRSNDGDFRVNHVYQIAELYNRKRSHYTEGFIYPYLRFEDFKQELFSKIRNLIRSNHYNHPWLTLDDQQLLVKAGLWRQDIQSSKEGYTLAALLLLGKDEVIQNAVPHYKIDALVRVQNTLRYDDRDYIQTNLIEAYERIMAFVAKHLPDKFYMEGDQRMSLRNKIFRELAANLLVHREYTNALPCTFVIHADRVETQNANNPHGYGPIDPDNFAPFPKNPVIAKFFTQLGLVEELGSGVLNVTRLTPFYTPGAKAQFVEEAAFRMIIPLVPSKSEGMTDTVTDTVIDTVTDTVTFVADKINELLENQVSKQVGERLARIVLLVRKHPGMRSNSIAKKIAVSEVSIRRDMQKLKDIVSFSGAPRSGGYYLSKKFEDVLDSISDK